MDLKVKTAKSRLQAFVVAGLILLAAMTGTWLVRTWQKAQIVRSGPAIQHEAVQEALAEAESRFVQFHGEVAQFAERLADDQFVRAQLDRDEAGFEDLIRYVAALAVPKWWSVEVIDSDGRAVAWKGHGYPRGSEQNQVAPASASFIVPDGIWRRALAVWHPVLDGDSPLGAIRVVRTIERRYPVQNDYLEDYDLRGTWQYDVGLPVDYAWTQPESTAAGSVPLLGMQADTLGYASVDLPPISLISQRISHRYNDVLAFLSLLLLGWLFVGLWSMVRKHPARMWPLGLLLLAAWGSRFVLMWLEIPGRWQEGKAPLSPLFDTANMYSECGWGLLQTSGDLLLTSLFVLVSSFLVLRAALLRFRWPPWRELVRQELRPGLVVWSVLASTTGLGLVAVLDAISRHVVLQSSVDLFTRDGLLPAPLVQVIFCALLLLAIGTAVLFATLLLVAFGVGHEEEEVQRHGGIAGIAAVVILSIVLIALFDWSGWVQWPTGVGFILAAALMLTISVQQREKVLAWITLRRVLPSTFAAAILLYPLTFRGLEERKHMHMEHAAEALEASRDAGIPDSIGSLMAAVTEEYRFDLSLDSVIMRLAPSHLDTLEVDAMVQLVDPGGNSRTVYSNGSVSRWPQLPPIAGPVMAQGPSVVAVHEREHVRFAGVGPPVTEDSLRLVVVVQRRAQESLVGDSPLVRVLTDTEASGAQAGVSMATYRSGTLGYKVGRAFREYRLDAEVAEQLETEPAVWRREVRGGRRYDTYYKRMGFGADTPRTVAVRASAPTTFDHLYYLLRLTVAGLMLGIPIFAGGVAIRWRKGLLPAARLHFRDRVLNAFLVVGIIAVVTVGMVGVEVVTEENDRAVQSWLRQHLQSIEAALLQQSVGDEPTYQVLERISLDSLAGQTGLDLMLYREAMLVGTTRDGLVENRVVDRRLPIEAFASLAFDGSDFAFVDHEIGTFGITAGYKAVPDESGALRYVLSVPALPEQERIEEERARTLAYLFGALLFVFVLVMATAALLASAVARPIGRLRAGLAAAAVGHFQQLPATRSKDEVGELVETFNNMQSQLAESRGRLALQERQLAWREMARQVAHEIKNPLTPMKLSVQHLRRALEQGSERKFRALFDRVTTTLIDQMNAMARIANEFASFARMPSRSLESVDLVEIIREAGSLMQEQASGNATIEWDLEGGAVYLVADKEELRRIYINLIKNALEAVRDKDEGRVVIAARINAAGEAESTVTDNGPGIPQETGPRIFEPSFSTKTSGTGLGLAIVRRSVEDLGGGIGYRPASGGGTVFWIKLPIQAPEKSR